MTRQQIKEEILGHLRGTCREGVEQTIGYILGSTYLTAHCHSHHRDQGGLARHSLEACRWALSRRGTSPPIASSLRHSSMTSAWPAAAVRRVSAGTGDARADPRGCLPPPPYGRGARGHPSPNAQGGPLPEGHSLAHLVWLADKTRAAGRVPLRDSSAA